MGQPLNAVAAWRRYRAAHPDGILRVEADVSIIETLGRIGETDEALSEANEFLRRHPDSERRTEIARLAGDLYRARGDCRHALLGLPDCARGLAPARRRRGRRLPPRGLPGAPGRLGRRRRRARLPAHLPEREVPRRGGGADRRVRAPPVGRAVKRAISLGCALLAVALAACQQTLVLDDLPPDAGCPEPGGVSGAGGTSGGKGSGGPSDASTDGRCFGDRSSIATADVPQVIVALDRSTGDDDDRLRFRSTASSSRPPPI